MTGPKKVICILCPGGLHYAGGIGRMMGNLLEVWSAEEGSPEIILLDTRGEGHIIFSPFHFVRALIRFTGLALRGRVRLLHVNLSKKGSTLRKVIATALARMLGVPYIIHLHSGAFGAFYKSLPGFARGLVREMLWGARYVVVLGQYWHDFVIEVLEVRPHKVKIIFNAVPQPPVLGSPNAETKHILFLGRLGTRKGVPELLDALSSPALAALPWRATLAGDGDVERFRKIAQQRGLAKRIAFPGWLTGRTTGDLLKSADILVLASKSENLPMSVIEGLAYGVAVIATPVGAVPEIVEDEVSALVVPPGNADAIEKALIRLLSDDALRLRIAAGGHEAFKLRLDAALVAQQFKELYDHIAPPDPVPGPAVAVTKQAGVSRPEARHATRVD